MKLPNDNVLCMGILALAFIEGSLILTHQDGTYALPIASMISGICGYRLKAYLTK